MVEGNKKKSSCCGGGKKPIDSDLSPFQDRRKDPTNVKESKIIFMGDAAVGKTSIIKTFL